MWDRKWQQMMNWKQFQAFCRKLVYREFHMIGMLWKAYQEMHQGIFELRGDIKNLKSEITFEFDILEYNRFEDELPKIEKIPPLPKADRDQIWEARKKRWELIKESKPKQTFETFFGYNTNLKFKMENEELICLD